jgi:hypothetical protein
MENSEFFKIVCIKNCEESLTAKHWWIDNKPRKIKSGEIFTTNNFNFFYVEDLARVLKNGEFWGIFERSNFMMLEEYRNTKIEELLD